MKLNYQQVDCRQYDNDFQCLIITDEALFGCSSFFQSRPLPSAWIELHARGASSRLASLELLQLVDEFELLKFKRQTSRTAGQEATFLFIVG